MDYIQNLHSDKFDQFNDQDLDLIDGGDSISKNSSNHSVPDSNNENGSIILDNIDDDLNDFDYNYIEPQQPIFNQKPIFTNEIEKYKLSNQVLTKSNFDLRNENKILEVEIGNYESQSGNLNKNTNSIFSQYDTSLQKFILSCKQSLKDSINDNLNMMDTITNLQLENQKLIKDNMNLINNYNNIVIESENLNRKNAEIQIFNERNENNLNNLEKIKSDLDNEIQQLKIQLGNLESQENDLILLNEANEKRRNDNDDLINRLKKTIDKLNEENSSMALKVNEEQNKMQQSNNNIYYKDNQIEQLKQIIQKINFDKEKIKEINENIKQEIDNKYDIKKNLLLKEKELSNDLQIIQEENETAKHYLKEKDNKINLLKDAIDKVAKSFDEHKYINPDLNIDELLKEDKEEYEEDKNEEKELELEIKKALEENIKKDNEINEITKMYEDIIKQKDEKIDYLQIQLGEPKENNTQPIMEGIDNEEEYNELNNDYNMNMNMNENMENMGNIGIRNEDSLNEQNLMGNTKHDDIEGLDDLD